MCLVYDLCGGQGDCIFKSTWRLVSVLKPVKVNDNGESDFTFIGLTIMISLYAKLGSGHFTVLNFC